MKYNLKMLVSVLLISFSSCNKDDVSIINNHQTRGKRIDIITNHNGDQRSYIIYIPSTYNSTQQHPLVFQLHGGSGNGEKFYNISGWNEIAEQNRLIIIYPTSYAYDIKANGCGNNLVNHWNNYNMPQQVCDPTILRDDTDFLNQIINEVKGKYAINEKRIYVAGFSNGSGMVSRLGVELSSKIAAVGGLAGFFPGDTIFSPERKLPVHIMLGTKDEKIVPQTKFNNEIPFDIDQAFTDPSLYDIIKTYIITFDLDPSYEITYASNDRITCTFEGKSGGLENVLHFSLLKDLGHRFPNPSAKPGAADLFWEFFQSNSL
ncbi:PHB depolymerase family esterase [Spongiivirga sp. MCCC 1A20706]|uniref:alpha/beta hydrolase family esterase n=1 Tax=Spongiivirga sp. MCCC 1A20706 TaxID=3160963 RepID=UPI003977C33C